MLRIDTALLVLGRGPAALVAAKVAGACGQPCLLVDGDVVGDEVAGDEVVGDEAPVALDRSATAILEEHGLVDVLRPHLAAVDPLTIAPHEFAAVFRQHCIADLNVGVYERMELLDRTTDGRSIRGVLTDGRSRWELVADTWIDGAALAPSLPAAIIDGAAAALDAITALTAARRS